MIAVAVGGGLGAAARLVIDGVIRAHLPHRFPWATAIINVTGSFLLGLVVAWGPSWPSFWQAAVGTGFLGGYTTFSTASFETARLALDRRPLAAALNALVVLAVCVGAASLGFALGRL